MPPRDRVYKLIDLALNPDAQILKNDSSHHNMRFGGKICDTYYVIYINGKLFDIHTSHTFIPPCSGLHDGVKRRTTKVVEYDRSAQEPLDNIRVKYSWLANMVIGVRDTWQWIRRGMKGIDADKILAAYKIVGQHPVLKYLDSDEYIAGDENASVWVDAHDNARGGIIDGGVRGRFNAAETKIISELMASAYNIQQASHNQIINAAVSR